MSATTITVNDIIRCYADDIAYAAEESPATDLGRLTDQLDTAARYYATAGINGHEDMETAAIHLREALNSSDETAHGAAQHHPAPSRPLPRGMRLVPRPSGLCPAPVQFHPA